jgi:hypothetical protein
MPCHMRVSNSFLWWGVPAKLSFFCLHHCTRQSFSFSLPL